MNSIFLSQYSQFDLSHFSLLTGGYIVDGTQKGSLERDDCHDSRSAVCIVPL